MVALSGLGREWNPGIESWVLSECGWRRWFRGGRHGVGALVAVTPTVTPLPPARAWACSGCRRSGGEGDGDAGGDGDLDEAVGDGIGDDAVMDGFALDEAAEGGDTVKAAGAGGCEERRGVRRRRGGDDLEDAGGHWLLKVLRAPSRSLSVMEAL